MEKLELIKKDLDKVGSQLETMSGQIYDVSEGIMHYLDATKTPVGVGLIAMVQVLAAVGTSDSSPITLDEIVLLLQGLGAAKED
jgi:hypothetical protein